VARRVKPSEECDSADLPKTRATRYKPALLSSTVYLHPSSSLHKTSPEYVVYADVAATEKRSYLGGATAVDASWLCDDAAALTSLSAPLEDPMPRYVPSKGIVVCFSQPHFGKHRWALPLRAERMRADEGGCGAFAAAVLSGAVSPPMQTLRERMAAKPSLCARAEGKTQRRVGELVHALQRRGVASKEELKAQWRRDPAYLMREATLWMKRGHEHFLERAWPRVVANALGEENAPRDSSSARQMTDQGARSGGGVAGVAVAGGLDEHAERAGERARLARAHSARRAVAPTAARSRRRERRRRKKRAPRRMKQNDAARTRRRRDGVPTRRRSTRGSASGTDEDLVLVCDTNRNEKTSCRTTRRRVVMSRIRSFSSFRFFFALENENALRGSVRRVGRMPSDTKTGELSVYRRNPASVGVRRSRDARRRRRAPILARHPACAWCAETGGVGGRACASNAREDAGQRVGGTFRDGVF
jgi:hypothetical protein